MEETGDAATTLPLGNSHLRWLHLFQVVQDTLLFLQVLGNKYQSNLLLRNLINLW